jgi:sulfate adenylyltransferase subunit 1
MDVNAIVPISALKGWNVVSARSDWCDYSGPSLLELLERLPVTPADDEGALAFAVQWVEKFHDSADTSKGRRVYWGRVGTGVARVGDSVKVFPSGQTAVIKEVLSCGARKRAMWPLATAPVWCWTMRWTCRVATGCWPEDSEVQAQTQLNVTLAWLDDEPWWPVAFTGPCTVIAG